MPLVTRDEETSKISGLLIDWEVIKETIQEVLLHDYGELTDDQILTLVKKLGKDFDITEGISWDVIEKVAGEIFNA